jgi:hypothetical protein
MGNEYEEWQELCREHEAAKEEFYDAFSPVTEKFTAIARGESIANPSDHELDALDKAWNRWDSIKRKMREFIEKHR